ncbi:60S ribosomal protein L7 [Hypoxylon texense]
MPPIRCTSAYSSSAAAKSFVRLFRASSPTASSSSSILDVLLPPPARAFHLSASRDLRTRSRNARTRNIVPGSTAVQRPFSTTPSWRKTQAVYNPQKDEDGNDMLLEITPRAANRLSQIMAKDKNPNLALRISVESGGCHGFQYLMSLTSLPPSFPSPTSAPPPPQRPETAPASPPQPISGSAAETAETLSPSTTTSASPSAPSVGEDDTILAFLNDDETSTSSSAATEAKLQQAATTTVEGLPKIILDGPSLELLKGSKVDFTMELIGSQFKIVDNPHATSSCGCGTSFDIKI